MAMLLWHLLIRNWNLMLRELKYYFINQFCFSNRLTGLTSIMSLQKSSRVNVPAFYPQTLVRKFLCFQNFGHAQKTVFREASRFYFDYFHESFHSFIRNRKQKIIIFSWGEEVYITLSYQIYFSYLPDYMANYIWNIKAFFNVIKK